MKKNKRSKIKFRGLRLNISSLNERARLLQIKNKQLGQEIEDINNKVAKSQSKAPTGDHDQAQENINQKLIDLNKNIKNLESQLEEVSRQQEGGKNPNVRLPKKYSILATRNKLSSTELNNLRIETARQETKLEDLSLISETTA